MIDEGVGERDQRGSWGRGAGRRVSLALAVVLIGGLVLWGGPASGTGGGDQAVWSGGGDLGSPSGYARVYFSNVGTEPLVGRTTVVAEVLNGPMRLTYAAFFPLGGPTGGDTITGVGPEVSPDGKRLVYHLDGTNAPTVSRELRVYFTGNRFMQPSSVRITFTHPDDGNGANDSVGFGPPP